MSSKTIGAQLPFKVLVPALRGSTDPSRGPSGNPDYKWKTFEQQCIIEKPGPNRVIQDGKRPGLANRTGLMLTGAPPSPATGTIEVVGNTFIGPTTILLGAYTLQSGSDFLVGSIVQATGSFLVNAAPASATLSLGGVALTPTGGAARTPGANNYNNTIGTVGGVAAEISAAINDPANGFVGFAGATPVGDRVNLVAVPSGSLGNAVVISSNHASVSASAGALSGGRDDVEDTALNIANAIDALPEFSASVVGATISLGGFVPGVTLFDASGASPYNLALTPDNGTLFWGNPYIGPPILSL